MTETPTPLGDILPCPFCGGEAEVESQSCGWRVACQSIECATQGPWPTDCTEAEALTAWNTRADSHHRLVEALEAERTWHEDHDKAISKQPNANTGDNGWRRMEHQERIAEIDAALKEAGQ